MPTKVSNIPLKEAIEVWQEMIDSGEYIDKDLAIIRLYERGVISKESYLSDCPLCAAYNKSGDGDFSCPGCPWPVSENVEGPFKCCVKGNAYRKWEDTVDAFYDVRYDVSQDELKEATQEVLDLLLSLL